MDPAQLARGLISFANLPLYEKARVNFPPPPDYRRPKENVAVKVLENVLNKVVFSGKEYGAVFVNSQVPPHESSSLAADLAIEYMTKAQTIRVLCFIEAKRTPRSESYTSKAVEEEALDYCKEFFGDRSNTAPFVYAGTLVGVHLRLWVVHRADQEEDLSLTPLWGSPYLGSNEDYKDLGDDDNGQDIIKTFHDMIRIAPQAWIGAGSTAIRSSGGGAIQLPRLGQPDFVPEPSQPSAPAPIHPNFSVGPK